MIQLLYLHWGTVSQTITTTGVVDAQSGRLQKINRSANVQKTSKRGRVKGLSGSGGKGTLG